MALRLRDLIKNVRACKTASEEREVIAKECAAIRTAFKEEDKENRHRNVAKLLYIHMLGYATHFGQMECLNLITSPSYSDKRIGYLGLMLLLDERQEVLMLVTNSLLQDLNHPNQYVVGLALCALANISSSSIARDAAPEVEKLMTSTNPYIKKKAALTAIRIVRKVPELQEYFVPRVKGLLSERYHGVLISGISLMIELCGIDPNNIKTFRKYTENLVTILKNLLLSGYAPEYDVAGITDPFLQVKVLRLMGILGKGDSKASDKMNDVLAQVATNTENLRNVGNSILYECVQTIMEINSETGLRVLAINILGRFLLNRDNNIRYVALNTLCKVVSIDKQAVQRHRNTVVDCLKDHDISIRRRALELIYTLVDESNVKILVRELLNFLVIADSELRPDLTANLCFVAQKYAPTKRWLVDTILKVLQIAGNHVPDEVLSDIIAIITQTPELQPYAVQKMYLALVKDVFQQALVQVGVWCVGEFGEHLVGTFQTVSEEGESKSEQVTVNDTSIIELFQKILRHAMTTDLTRQYVLTALAKLSDRLKRPTFTEAATKLESQYSTHLNLELQQRAVEYTRIYNLPPSTRSVLLEHMPPLTIKEERKAPGSKEEKKKSDAGISAVSTPAVVSSVSSVSASAASLIDLDLLGGPLHQPTSGSSVPASGRVSGAGLDLLSDLLGGTPGPSTVSQSSLVGGADPLALLLGGGQGAPIITSPAAPPPGANTSLLDADLVGAPSSIPIIAPSNISATPATPGSFPQIVAFQKNGLTVTFDFQKQPNNPQLIAINISCVNSLNFPMTGYTLLASVPKWIKIQMAPPSGHTIPQKNSGRVTQLVKLMNTEQKPIQMRLKIEYTVGGQKVSELAEVVNFPPGL